MVVTVVKPDSITSAQQLERSEADKVTFLMHAYMWLHTSRRKMVGNPEPPHAFFIFNLKLVPNQ